MTRIIVLIVASALAAECGAADYFRLVADLDGNKRAEVITASISGSGDFQKYSVQVGSANYSGKFFAAAGDLPQITLTRINYAGGIKQILITTLGPASCNYELLSYIEGRLGRLLKHGSKNCNAPQSLGNGQIELLTREGFWDRRDRYTLDSSGTKLNRDTQEVYPVGVPGVAEKLTEMQAAGCKSASIPQGSYVLVKDYDIARKRYLVKNLGDACGWVPEDQMSEAVGALPWAG